MRSSPFLALALLSFGCVVPPPEAPPANDAAAPSADSAPAITAPPATSDVTGTVAETMDSAGYTYLRLQTPDGDLWAAIPQSPVAVGSVVTIAQPMVMADFESPTLGRKFATILFGTLASPGAPTAATLPAGGSTPAAPVGEPIQVAKAEGPDGKTVAEVFAQSAALKDKTVSVRAQVVKVTSGVMGKNWVHVQDGTGSTVNGDGDITVTTDAEVGVGTVVVVRGTVHTDMDFGAGYTYPVMIELATLEH